MSGRGPAIPAEVMLGGAALALALTAAAAVRLGIGLPALAEGPPGWKGGLLLAALFGLAMLGALQLWRRLPAGLRGASAPAYAGLLVLVAAVARAGGGDRVATAVPPAVAVAVAVTAVGAAWRRRRAQPWVWLGVPALATGLGLRVAGLDTVALALGLGSGLAIALAGMVVVGVWRSGRREVALAAAVPLCGLPVLVATRVRFVSGGHVVGGYDLGWARLAMAVLALLGTVAIVLGARRWPGRLSLRRSRRLVVAVGLPLLTVGLGFHYRVHDGTVSPGESTALASVTALRAGRLPYRDFEVGAGLGEQVVQPWLATHLLGDSLRSVRLLRDVVEPVERAAWVAAGAVALPARWAALAAMLAMSDVASPGTGGGALPVWLALGLTLAVLGRGRWPVAAAAGAASGWAAVWRPETGVPLMVAAMAGLVACGLRERRWRRAVAGYAAGAGLVVGPVGIAAAVLGLLPSWLAAYGATDRGGWPGLRPAGAAVGPVVLAAVAAGGLALVARGRRRGIATAQGKLLFLWLWTTLLAVADLIGLEPVEAVAVKGAVAILVLCLVAARMRRWEASLACLVIAWLLVPLGGRSAPLVASLSGFHDRQEVGIEGRSLLVRPARSGGGELGVLLAAPQAESLGVLATQLDRLGPRQSFFDLTDHGVLYFLTGRPPPTRLVSVGWRTSMGTERAVVAELERDPPRWIVYRAPAGEVGGAGSGDPLRHCRIVEHVLARYRPERTVGGFTLLAPSTTGRVGAVPEAGPVDMGERASRLPWHPEAGESLVELATARRSSGAIELQVPEDLRARVRALQLALDGRVATGAWLTWATPPGGPKARVRFDVSGRGRHRYLIPVGCLAEWVWPERVTAVELRLAARAAVELVAVKAWVAAVPARDPAARGRATPDPVQTR